jgi:large subunit ribosomal protein L32
MAVPKTKTSRARKGSRSAHNFRATAAVLTACPQCHAPVRPHTVCEKCGYYKGTKRIETEKAKKQEKKA